MTWFSDAALEALRASGRTCFVHVTRAAVIADIAASGGLLAPSYRRDGTVHGWGRNADLGKDLVCCSFMPCWGLINQRFAQEEPVMLIVDALGVAELPGARLSPLNSARHEARRYLKTRLNHEELVRRCLANSQEAEVLVSGGLPLALTRFIVFHDREARDAWWPAVERACGGTCAAEPLIDGDLGRFRFPPDLEVCSRLRPVPPGRNQRARPFPPSKSRSLEPVSLAEIEEDLTPSDDWDWDEGADLLDELYGDHARRPSTGDFIDWPSDDDEVLLG